MEELEVKAWRCIPCGYVHRCDAPPDECPVCGAGPEQFEACQAIAVPKPVVARDADHGLRLECAICGYNHAGESAPGKCPLCGADGESFRPSSD